MVEVYGFEDIGISLGTILRIEQHYNLTIYSSTNNKEHNYLDNLNNILVSIVVGNTRDSSATNHNSNLR